MAPKKGRKSKNKKFQPKRRVGTRAKQIDVDVSQEAVAIQGLLLLSEVMILNIIV